MPASVQKAPETAGFQLSCVFKTAEKAQKPAIRQRTLQLFFFKKS